MGRFPEADAHLNEAYKYTVEQFGEENDVAAFVHIIRGLYHRENKDFNASVESYTKAKNIMAKKLSEDHPKMIELANCIKEV